MLISSTSPSLVQPPPSPDSHTADATTVQPASADSGAPAVVVTLSQDAQGVLAQGTPPPDPAQVLRDQLARAAAVLNDTSGSVSTDDQFAAFKLISQTLLHGPAGNGAADANLQFASALVDSAFAQHLNQVFGYIASQNTITSSGDPFAQRAEVDARTLAAFNSMSQADQQLYVSAQAFHTETGYELPWVHQSGAVIKTSADFGANLQAQIQIDQALGAAIEDPRYAADTMWNGHVRNDADARVLALGKLAAAAGDQQMIDLTALRSYRNSVDWTQKAQAYLAKYGPFPASAASSSGDGATTAAPAPFIPQPTTPTSDSQRVLTAIATLNDPKASMDDKMAALDVKPLKNSPATAWVLSWISERSAFAKAVDRASSGLMNEMMSAGRQAQVRGEDAAPNGAQLTLDYLNRRSHDDQRLIARGYGYSDVGSWKADLQSQAAAFAAQYGEPSPPGAKGSSQATTKVEDGIARALKTLRQVSASQTQFVEAERARRMGDDLKRATGTNATDEQTATNADPNSAKALATLRQIIDNLQSFTEDERARRAQSGSDGRSTSGAKLDRVA